VISWVARRKNHHGREDGGREILRLGLRMTSEGPL